MGSHWEKSTYTNEHPGKYRGPLPTILVNRKGETTIPFFRAGTREVDLRDLLYQFYWV